MTQEAALGLLVTLSELPDSSEQIGPSRQSALDRHARPNEGHNLLPAYRRQEIGVPLPVAE